MTQRGVCLCEQVNEMIHIATSEFTDEGTLPQPRTDALICFLTAALSLSVWSEKKQPQNLPLIRLRVREYISKMMSEVLLTRVR